MMERRVAFIFVGLVSLLLVGAIIGFVLWAHQRHGQNVPRKQYAIYFNQAVNGLNLGSSVRYLGVESGQVEDITLDSEQFPPRVRVVVGLNSRIPISNGDVATLKPSGITGVSYIDLRHDVTAVTVPISPQDEKLPIIRSEASELDLLLNNGSNSAKRLEQVLERLEKFLNDDNLAHFNKTMNSLDHITSSADSLLMGFQKEDLSRNAAATLRDGRQAINNISELSKSLRENPSRLLYPPSQEGVEIKP